jgi:tetratricopeptide (TPR) repeat protein
MVTASARADKVEDAAKSFTDGRVLVFEGKLTEALPMLEAAAKDDPSQAQYVELAKAVKKAAAQQDELAKEQDPANWTKLANELRTFYYEQEAFEPALKIDRTRAERQKGVASSIMIAQDLFELRKDSEATELLAAIPEGEQTATTRAYLALGYARQGRKTEAQALIDKFDVAREVDPQVLFALSGAYANLGNNAKCIEAMTRSLELTPPAEIKARRMSAGRSADFGSMSRDGLFQQAMQTASKVGSAG